MDYSSETNDNGQTMTVKGSLCMNNVLKLRSSLLAKLDEVEHLIFETDSLSDISFGCIQVLCSACRTASLYNKQFTILSPHISSLRRKFEEAGYMDAMTGCVVKNGKCIIHGIIAGSLDVTGHMQEH